MLFLFRTNVVFYEIFFLSPSFQLNFRQVKKGLKKGPWQKELNVLFGKRVPAVRWLWAAGRSQH